MVVFLISFCLTVLHDGRWFGSIVNKSVMIYFQISDMLDPLGKTTLDLRISCINDGIL